MTEENIFEDPPLSDDRKHRLSATLRQNLHRRKQQKTLTRKEASSHINVKSDTQQNTSSQQ